MDNLQQYKEMMVEKQLTAEQKKRTEELREMMAEKKAEKKRRAAEEAASKKDEIAYRMAAEKEKLRRSAEEVVSANNNINPSTYRTALTISKDAAIRKWKTAPSRNTPALETPALDTPARNTPALYSKVAASKKPWSGSSFKVTTSLAGLSTSTSKTTTPPKSGTSKPSEAAEYRQTRLQVPAAASAATRPAVARPATALDNTPSEGLPRVIPVRTLPYSTATNPSVDPSSTKRSALDPLLEKYRLQRLNLTRLPRLQVAGNFEAVGDGELDNKLDVVPARKISTAYNSSIDPTPVELARSKDAKDRSRRFRQTVQNGGDFEIVGHGELDDEFDFIDGEVPSAVNGSSHSDADAIMDGLDSAFRAGWDDDE